MMVIYPENVSGFVLDWLGRPVDLIRVERKLWSFSGRKQGLLVTADTVRDARLTATRFVSRVDGKTDKRRKIWFYT